MHNIEARIGTYNGGFCLDSHLGPKWARLIYTPGSEVKVQPADSKKGLRKCEQSSSVPLNNSTSANARLFLIACPHDEIKTDEIPNYDLSVWNREGYLELVQSLCQRYGAVISPVYINYCIVCSKAEELNELNLSQVMNLIHFEQAAHYTSLTEYVDSPRIAIIDTIFHRDHEVRQGSSSLRNEISQWVLTHELEYLSMLLEEAEYPESKSVLSLHHDSGFTECTCNTALRIIEHSGFPCEYSILVVPHHAVSKLSLPLIWRQICNWENELPWIWEHAVDIPELEILNIAFENHDQYMSMVSLIGLSQSQQRELLDSAVLVV